MKETGDIRIDKMMPHLCEAWPVVPFDECLVPASASYRKLKSTDIKASGRIPVIDQGESFISGYTDQPANEYPGALPVIVFGDHTRRFKFIDFKFAIGAQGTHLLYPCEDLTPKFFYHYLSALNLESQGYSRHYKFLKQALVPVPPLPEQRRIVTKLEKMLSKVDACQQRLAKIPILLKRFRQSVLAAVCSGRLTADWRETTTLSQAAEEHLKELQHKREEADSAAGRSSKFKIYDYDQEELTSFPELPPTWIWCSASACSDVRDGTHDSPKYHDSGIPLVTSKNLLPDGIEFSNVKFISREDYEQIAKRSAVSDGDILFAMIGTIGNATVVSGGHPFAIKNVALFRTFGNLVLANFLRYWLNSPYTGSFFKDHQKGSSQPFAPLNLLRSLPVPFPPLAEQQEIVRLVEALFALADQLEARYAKARAYVEKLTQSILAKAFRGELVPQDPNDEPAEALLRRIHQPSKNGKKA